MPAGIDPFHGVSKENKATILKFRSDIVLDGLSNGTIKTYTTMLINLSRTLNNAPFKQIPKEKKI